MGAQFGIIKDNKLNKDKFVSLITDAAQKEIAKQVADACIEETDAERCEAAFKIASCLDTQGDKLGLKMN
jgi:hypothetical protein